MLLPFETQQALGATPPWVWQDAFVDLHPPADPLSLCEGEVEQTYRQFINMGRREPNERGTGRWTVTSTRKTIALVALDKGVTQEQLERVRLYMSAFFHGFVVEVLDADNSLLTRKNQSFLRHGTSCTKIQRCTIDGTAHIEVFSLFDAMVSLIQTHHYCVLGLTSHPLAEEWIESDDENDDAQHLERISLLGRACGDRICVVHVSSQEQGMSETTLLATCTHEVLHCMGVDHCTTFRCLMSAQSIEGEDCLFLSPLNLKKYVMGVLEMRGMSSDECDKFATERYHRMRRAFHTLGYRPSKPYCQWIDRKISLMENRQSNERASSEVVPM